METGAILIGRQIFSSAINYKPAEWFKIWIYLVANVQWQDYRNLKRGQGYFKYRYISEAIRVKESSIKKFVMRTKSEGMLETHKTMRGVVITILNYDDRQDLGTIKELRWNHKGTIKEPLYKDTNKPNKEDKEEETHFSTLDEIESRLEKTLDDFYIMRKEIKSPMSDLAKKLLINKLEKLYPGDDKLKIETLEQSIIGNWKTVYELKDKKKQRTPQSDGDWIKEFNKLSLNSFTEFKSKYGIDKYREIKKIYQQQQIESVLSDAKS